MIRELCTGRDFEGSCRGLLMVLLRTSVQATEDNHENLQSAWPMLQPVFETGYVPHVRKKR